MYISLICVVNRLYKKENDTIIGENLFFSIENLRSFVWLIYLFICVCVCIYIYIYNFFFFKLPYILISLCLPFYIRRPKGSDCGIVNVNIPTSGAEIGGAFGTWRILFLLPCWTTCVKHCLPGKHRDWVPKAFIGSWSRRHARPNTPPDFRLSEGKLVLNIKLHWLPSETVWGAGEPVNFQMLAAL